MKSFEYKEHVKAKCFPKTCNLGADNCPVPEYGFRLGALEELKHLAGNPHPSHCCVKHGCKYGWDDCPVYLGDQKQEYPCESCGWDMDEFEASEVLDNYDRFIKYLKKFLIESTEETYCLISRITNNNLSKSITVFWAGKLPHSSIVNTEKLNEWIKENCEI